MNYAVFYTYFIDKSYPSFKAPLNQLYNTAWVYTPKDTTIVTPNSDTPYSFVAMDLRAEPYVICNPEIEKSRYFSVMLVDMYTFNYGYMAAAPRATARACNMIAGPGWKGEKPEGIARMFRSETDFSIRVIRTQLFNAGDIENVKKIQAGYRGQTLSHFQNKPAPLSRSRISAWPKIDKQMADSDPFADLELRPAILSSDRACGSGGSAARSIRKDRSRGRQTLRSRQAQSRRKDRARNWHEEWARKIKREDPRSGEGRERLACLPATLSKTDRSTRATGRCAPQPRWRESTAIAPRRRSIRYSPPTAQGKGPIAARTATR